MDFESDGVRLHYEIHGPEAGHPVVLVHGFASDYRLNWVGTRWQETLIREGFRIVGLDCRGHGKSEKPHEPAQYSIRTMAGDVLRLLDHLDLGSVAYLGYSMGARIGLEVVLESPRRVQRAVLGGIGRGGTIRNADGVADALLGATDGGDPIAQSFYRFASARPANDLVALAACFRGMHGNEVPGRLAAIRTPILIVVGERDEIAGSGADLVELIPTARLFTLRGRDHMGAVPAREFKQAAVDFLTAE